MCPFCRSLEHELVDLAGTGTVYSYAILHHPQHPRLLVPRGRGIVDLDEGVRHRVDLVGINPGDVRYRYVAYRVTFEATEHHRSFRCSSLSTRGLRASLVARPRSSASARRSSRRRPAGSGRNFASEAIVAALRDAGLTTDDVDGFVSYTIDPVEETELVRALGTPEVRWSSRVPYGGGGSQGVLLHAAAAVAGGAARVVVAYRAIKARSGERFGRAQVSSRPSSAHSGSTASQWCSPFGVLTPASWMALNATRYMHTYGVTSADFGRAVVQLRDYAATNPNAHFYGTRSRSTIIRRRGGSPNPRFGSSTAARRPTARSRW